ncbi:TIGR02281 family clan AA aspartic protease [Congregibacter variabilis]|uniref:TIGR02281 family clan AA aspartic protease n=1 Tax=Congregibacter variabilis TaxID=3081200 RepID=A0ABZ0I3H4_9GAMM|nr:TIGR02281 family clan AA aspartic protease [Congregibacter sp. IMCC43200]
MRWPLVLLAVFFTSGLRAEIVVEALLPGLAVMQIDGSRVTLREGESRGDVLLISADAQSALVEIGGRQQQLRVSQRISGQFSEPQERSIAIPRNEQMQYLTTAEINNVRLSMIVDTGANIIALNTRDALAVGIARDEGVVASVQTAGAIVPARSVVLETVVVGGIRVDGVTATVIDGEQPSVALLGMSYLQHVEMQEQGGILTLRARW